MSNKTIGMVTDPHLGELCAVRVDKSGKLYYMGKVGKITPNLPAGQAWLQENATLWGEDAAPADAPEWIRRGLSFHVASMLAEPAEFVETVPADVIEETNKDSRATEVEIKDDHAAEPDEDPAGEADDGFGFLG